GPGVRVPGASLPHIEQFAACTEHYRTGILELHAKRFSLFHSVREHQADQVVSAPRKLAAGEGFVLDKAGRLAINKYLAHAEISRQLQDRHAQSRTPCGERELGFCSQVRRRLHLYVHTIVAYFERRQRPRILFCLLPYRPHWE